MASLTVFDAKVVNDEYKDEGVPGVAPEPGCCGTLVVPMIVESFGEKVIGELAGLFQAVSTFSDLKVDPSTVCEFMEIVFDDEFTGDVVQFYSHLFWAIKGGAKVEAFYVEACEFCHWL